MVKKIGLRMLILVLFVTLMVIMMASVALAASPPPFIDPDVGMEAVEAPADTSESVAVSDVDEADPGGFAIFVIMLTLAVLIESLAEVVKAAISPATLPKWLWFLITSIIGMALCVLFKIDLFAALGFVGGAAAVWVSELLTGIAVGAGSGFVHDILGKLTAAKTTTLATTTLIGTTETTVKNDTQEQ
jgi:hypothetical protein